MRAKIFALALTAAAVTACDKTTDPTASLTAAEARAIALAIDDAGLAAADAEASSGGQLNLTPTRPSDAWVGDGTADFNFTGACDLGGAADIDGDSFWSVDQDSGVIEFGVTAAATYGGCSFANDGVEIEIDGVVDFALNRLLDFKQGLVEGSQSYNGTLAYVTSEGKEGICPIDVAADFSLTQNNASRTIAGSVCGQSVNATTTWTKTN